MKKPDPLATNCFTLPATLQRGDCGQDVEKLQRKLLREDIPVAVDGIFGPQTESAVKIYQQGQGLKADGIVGPHTWTQFEDSG